MDQQLVTDSIIQRKKIEVKSHFLKMTAKKEQTKKKIIESLILYPENCKMGPNIVKEPFTHCLLVRFAFISKEAIEWRVLREGGQAQESGSGSAFLRTMKIVTVCIFEIFLYHPRFQFNSKFNNIKIEDGK